MYYQFISIKILSHYHFYHGMEITLIGSVHREKYTSIFNFYPNYVQDLRRCSIGVVSNRLVAWNNSANGFIVKWNAHSTQEGKDNYTDESSDGIKGYHWKCYCYYFYHSLRTCSFEDTFFIFEVILQSFPLHFMF